jgi:plasmid maintenance system killer protein
VRQKPSLTFQLTHSLTISLVTLLKDARKGTWSVTVSDNWRLTFTFSERDAYDVNLEDYH